MASCSRVAFGLVTILSCGLVLAEAQQKSPQLPDASQLLSQHIEATGGEAAYRKVKTIVRKGTITIRKIRGRFISYQKAPNLMLEVVELPGVEAVRTGFDGRLAWEVNPVTGAKIHHDAMYRLIAREASWEGEWNWRKFFKQAVTKRRVKIDSHPAYEVEMRGEKGDMQLRYFDEKSGRLIRTVDFLDTLKGKQRIVTDLSGYKRFGMLLLPTRYFRKVVDVPMEITVTDIQINVDIPERRFALPAKVRSLLKGT